MDKRKKKRCQFSEWQQWQQKLKANQSQQELDNQTRRLRNKEATTQEKPRSKGAIIEQATEQHDKFTVTSSNNMNQHKEKVQNFVSNKLQEPHDITAKWKDDCKRQTVERTCDKQGKLFERKCQDTQKSESEKAKKFCSNKEKKCQTMADKTESELPNQAQSLPD
jgi:hypothetical protein